MNKFTINGEFAELILLSGLAVFIFSMFVGMLFLLNDGNAPAIIMYPIVVGLILVAVGLLIRAANKFILD